MPTTPTEWWMLALMAFLLFAPLLKTCDSGYEYEDCDYAINHGCQ